MNIKMDLYTITKNNKDCNASCKSSSVINNQECLNNKYLQNVNNKFKCYPPPPRKDQQPMKERICLNICKDIYGNDLKNYSMKRGIPTLNPGQGISTYPYGVSINSGFGNFNEVNNPFGNYPHYNPKYTPTKYSTVKDTDKTIFDLNEGLSVSSRGGSFNNPNPKDNNPFNNSTRQITGGKWAEINKARPYQFLYNFMWQQNDCNCNGNYGEILKGTQPLNKDVN